MEINEKGKTYRWWFCTYNNPPEDIQQCIKGLDPSYALFQLEKGDTGTPHIQALLYYVTGKRQTHFKGVPMWCKGISAQDALFRVQGYCTKTDTRIDGPWEVGIKPKCLEKGKDWETARKLAKEGRFEEIQASIYIPYYGNLHKIHHECAKPTQADNIRGLWVFGKPGTGKSHYVREHFGDDLYIKPQNKWWDGYNGQQSVLLDDFDSACLAHYLKIWADKWPCSGEIKGGTVPLQHKLFAITSNFLPEDLFKDTPEGNSSLRDAIRRRFIFVFFKGYREYRIGDKPGQYPDDGIYDLSNFIDKNL